jgi:hypothetical protein
LTLACKDLDWTRRLAGREEKLRHVRDAVTNRSPLRLFGM